MEGLGLQGAPPVWPLRDWSGRGGPRETEGNRGANAVTILTGQPPGHADDQQDDGTHQQDGDACDEPVHPQGYVVCGKQNDMSDTAEKACPAGPELSQPRCPAAGQSFPACAMTC